MDDLRVARLVPVGVADPSAGFPLTGSVVLIGRGPGCDVALTDPTVSRRHAQLSWSDGAAWLADVGSSAGTSVNGHLLDRPRRLAPGDRVRLGQTELRYEVVTPVPTSFGSTTPQLTTEDAASRSRFDIGSQEAGTINNVGRDQHLSFVQHVQQQRESFLREIAATKTRARWLIWGGALLMVGGLAPYAFWVLSFIRTIFGSLASGVEPDLSGMSMDAGLIGFGVAVVGQITLVVGIVLHIVATARRRRLDRELPSPQRPHTTGRRP